MSSVRRFLPLLALASFLVPAAAVAQRPGAVLPPPSLPTSPGAVPQPAPAPTPVPDDGVRVQFPNSQITDVLTQYETLTGKHVLADPNVNGQININIPEKVPREVAIRIIETQLMLNGFPMLPDGDDIIKVLGVGKQVRSAGVPLFSEMSQVPTGEQTVSFLLRLRYLDPSETATQIGQYILPSSYNGFTPLPKSGAIIITETASTVRKLVSLITSLDNPAAPVVEKFLKLERADASKTVEFLNSVFDTKSSGAGGQTGAVAPPGNPPGVRRTIRRINEDGQPIIDPSAGFVNQNALAAGLIALNGESIIQGRITLTPDVRTNRIHVVTAPVNMPLVEKLVEEYDANTPFASPVRRDLRFVNARDVLPILIQALSEPGSDQNGANSGGGSSAPKAPTQSNTNQGGGLFGNNGSSSNSSSGFGSSGSSGGSGSEFGSEELNTQPVDTTPTEATVGTTKIIADPRSNTIILLGSAEAKDKVFKVLDQLDVRAPQVVIRVIIGELSIGNNTELGFNYLLRRSKGAIISQFNNGFVTTATPSPTGSPGDGTGGTSTASSTLNTLTTLATGVGGSFTGVAGIISVTKSLDVILSALESTNRFKVVNRPVLFTSNNKKAIIVSGQEIAVPTESLSTVTNNSNGGLATNVEFKTVALQLEVVPLINSDREVTLDIVQKLDSLSGTSVTVGGNAIPTISKRELKSSVSAPNGSTVVLGGLITESDQQTSGNVPYLSKIPLLGELFKTRTRNVSRSELIILLHPEVTNTPTEVAQQRAQEDRHMYLEHDLDEQLVPTPKPTPRVKKVVTKTSTTITTTPTTKTVVQVRKNSTPTPTPALK